MARAFIEHGMHKQQLPVKLWYHLPMFRYERPQAGRYREHTQLGAEAIGSEDPLLDVEVIALLADIYRRLEVPGLRLALGSMGDADSRGPYRERLVDYVERYAGDLDEDARERLRLNPLRLFDTKVERIREVMAEAPKLIDHLSPAAQAHRERVNEGLAALGIDFVEDGTLVRGFDYYTKTVFEFSCDRLGAQSGIGGGGRYDGLVAELGGPDVPGIGWGCGIDRIVLALAGEEGAGESEGIDVYLAVPDAGLRVEALRIARDLRAAGISVDSDMRGDRGMKALMRQAAALGARQVVIVGPREWESQVAGVRDMESGEQREIALAELTAALAAKDG